jgi:hypothetical protein
MDGVLICMMRWQDEDSPRRQITACSMTYGYGQVAKAPGNERYTAHPRYNEHDYNLLGMNVAAVMYNRVSGKGQTIE